MRQSFSEALADHLRAGYPLILVRSWEEPRVVRAVTALAAQRNLNVVEWTATQALLAGAGELPDTTAVASDLQRLATHEGPGVVLLKDFHAFLGVPGIARTLRDLLPELAARGRHFLILGPNPEPPVELEKEVAIIDLPLPGLVDLRAVLDDVVAEVRRPDFADLTGPLAEAVTRAGLGLTEREAARVFRKVLTRPGAFTRERIPEIIEEKKRLLKQSDLLEFFEPDEGLEAVGGLEELKRWLRERERAFGADAEKFGLPSPKGLLLLGVQGCGKSLTAKAVADLWKFPLLRLDLSAAFGVRGSAEEALRRAIKVSESLAPCVLWIDEIEKGFAGVSGDEPDINATRAFGSFITWLQEKKLPVFVVATANDVRGLPPELLRKGRFDEIFFVDLPDVHERERILAIHLKRRGRDPLAYALKRCAEATDHYSGAELEQVVVAGLYRAFGAGRELQNDDLVKSIEETVPLYATYEERIKAMRDWAKRRARMASRDVTLLDLFKAG
jgi:AAA+ superfamily predicted ATPase